MESLLVTCCLLYYHQKKMRYPSTLNNLPHLKKKSASVVQIMFSNSYYSVLK